MPVSHQVGLVPASKTGGSSGSDNQHLTDLVYPREEIMSLLRGACKFRYCLIISLLEHVFKTLKLNGTTSVSYYPNDQLNLVIKPSNEKNMRKPVGLSGGSPTTPGAG